MTAYGNLSITYFIDGGVFVCDDSRCFGDKKKKYRRQLQQLYGSFPDRTYSAEELDKISRYYWHRREVSSHDIDEITWNDLGMDSIFARMNYTQSSSGEEYLYAMLRRPATDDRDGAKAQMSAQIDYMMEHEKERLDTMMSLKELGSTGKYALSDYLDYLGELGVRSNKVHYVYSCCWHLWQFCLCGLRWACQC